MKKIVIFVLSVIVSLSFFACKEHDQSCLYELMEYNSHTKQCECMQLLDIENAPALKHNDYNTVLAVNQNFYYASIDNEDYPYYSHEGDTIMFYGNVGKVEHSYPDSTWVRLSIDDVSGGFGIGRSLIAECPVAQFEGIDTTSQCYVTGVLTFDLGTSHIEWPIGALAPGHCETRRFFLNIVDIHN